MANLGVHLPTFSPRVSDHIEQVTSFIQRLEDKGFAYEAKGSVYFDTCAFTKAGFTYHALIAKKGDESTGMALQKDEGEGNEERADFPAKKDPKDFALWKACKVCAS